MSIPAILLLATLIAYMASLWKLFKKAGQPAWAGFIPGYNFFVWQKITARPWYWILVLIIPGVQFLMLIIMNVQLAWSFGHRGTVNTLLAIFAPFYLIPKMAFSDDVKYTGNLNWKVEGKRGGGREWADALLFAIIVAFIVRTFVFEAFTIPTGSMEKSMLIGDYLFVSKARYGAKLPETPISFPLTHHTIPVLDVPSFLDWQKLDYYRLPGWADIELGDPIVFNYPLGDTVVVENEVTSWYHYQRVFGLQLAGSYDEYAKSPKQYHRKAAVRMMADERMTVRVRPKDKKENYVKRCVGMPGQTIEIKDGTLLLDGQAFEPITGLQHEYLVTTSKTISPAMEVELKKQLGINKRDLDRQKSRKNIYFYHLTEDQAEDLAALDFVKDVEPQYIQRSVNKLEPLPIFPNDPNYDWTIDNFGPYRLPATDLTIDITLANLPLYERAIRVYEENDLKVKDGKIYINGVESSSYTFKLNYYWMMGDNRHRSQDSRFFGPVPEDHVVGRPSFTWLSLDNEQGLFDGKIRWSRMFKGVD